MFFPTTFSEKTPSVGGWKGGLTWPRPLFVRSQRTVNNLVFAASSLVQQDPAHPGAVLTESEQPLTSDMQSHQSAFSSFRLSTGPCSCVVESL